MSDDGMISWRGVPLDDIFDGFQEFDDRNEAPKIEESENHTILFELPLKDPLKNPVPLNADADKWDDDFVKLPNSPDSVYFEIDDEGNKIKKFRWDLIKESFATKINNSYELEKCIKAYNTKFESTWHFKSLHTLFEDELGEEGAEYFFNLVMPKIVEIALKLPELIKCPIPLIRQSMNHILSMSREQAACLLANAFLCTFPKRNGPRRNTDYPEINFNRLYCNVGTSIVQKLKCICNYFKRVLVMSMPNGVLTFQRRSIEIESFPKWEECDLKFSSVKWHIDSYGRIEKGCGMLQMDFANRYLGGGCLGHGSVQEEIRFMINPELIVGMLFFEAMKSNEAILIYGTEQINKYSGYAGSFRWEGNHYDTTPCDRFRRRLTHIVAIDALPFRNPYMQFEEKLIRRDVNKAFCGFYHDSNLEHKGVPIAGGFWGCGAFGGFNKLKCLIQLIACVATRRNLVFYTFGNEELVEEMHNMFTYLSINEISVGQLWSYLAVFKSLNKKFDEFYQFIYDQHSASIFIEQLRYQHDNMNISEDVMLNMSENNEKRRAYSDESHMECTQESSLNYHVINPSKRTRTEHYDHSALYNRLTGNILDNDDNSDIGSEVEIMDNSEYADVESLEEIVIVTNDSNRDDKADEYEEMSPENEDDDKETEEEEMDTKLAQQKTILDYFKPKSTDSSQN